MENKGPLPQKPMPPKIPSKISNLTGDQLRTMRRDIEMLKKGERPTKTIVPPKNLPIVEPKISREAEKEATRQAFGEVMKEVGEINQKREESLKPEEEKEPVIHPSERTNLFSPKKEEFKSATRTPLFPPEKDSEPASIPSKPLKPIEPIKPIEPVKKPELPKIPEPPKKQEVPTPKKSKKGLFIALAVIVVLAIIGGGAYYWFFMRQPATHFTCQDFKCVSVEGKGEDTCQLDDDCLPPEPEKPTSLIPSIETKIIEVFAGQESGFLTDLRAIANQQTGIEGIKRILVKKMSTTEAKYASLTELSELMGITVPLALKSSFEDDYTLFIYTPGTEESDLCQGVDNLGCSGSRLGLVVSLTDKTTAVGELVQWEDTILDDLESFILSETTGKAAFQYSMLEDLKGASFVRYTNLPISPISIDYGIKDDLLIISTSKNSFFKALELIP